MSTFLKILAQVPPVLLGLLFCLQGGLALVNPESAANSWGFAWPDDGKAMSGMAGLMASHGAALGLCLLIAVIRRESVWYYPPMLLFFFLGMGRLVSGAAHGAAFLPERFIPEFVFVVLLFIASRSAAPRTASDAA